MGGRQADPEQQIVRLLGGGLKTCQRRPWQSAGQLATFSTLYPRSLPS